MLVDPLSWTGIAGTLQEREEKKGEITQIIRCTR
jgi:hypothetical protein